jgi:uncharacterized protein YbcI
MSERQTQDRPVGGVGPAVAEISREIVEIYADYFGRGPTKAKTIWQDDVVVCALRDAFTRAERVLIDAGRLSDVRRHRQAFKDAIEPRFYELVERATGRTVAAFLSQVSENGVAAEVFILEPEPEPEQEQGLESPLDD